MPYAHPSPVGKLDLDRRRRAQCGAITAAVIDRGDHHFRETALGAAQLLAPPIDLSGTNVSSTGDLSDNRPRRKGRSHDGALLRLTPRPSPLGAGNNLHSGHLDVSAPVQAPTLAPVRTSGPRSRLSARRPSPEGYSASARVLIVVMLAGQAVSIAQRRGWCLHRVGAGG